MQTLSRLPAAIQAQINAFKASLPDNVNGPPEGDFSAKLEWDSWMNHLEELEQELSDANQRADHVNQLNKELSENVLKPDEEIELCFTVGVRHNVLQRVRSKAKMVNMEPEEYILELLREAVDEPKVKAVSASSFVLKASELPAYAKGTGRAWLL
jgi:hypothetical protein